MIQRQRQRQRPADRVARIVTELFAPAVLACVLPVVVAVRVAPTPLAGLGWGLVTTLFTGVIPYAIIWVGVRRGELTDHHIGVREQRRKPVLLGLASVLVGLALLVVADAPREIVLLVVVMLAVLLLVGVANHWWKLSAHSAVAAASATILIIVFGAPMAITPLFVALIAWSRVRLADHTVGQVVAGAVGGALVAAPSFLVVG